MNNIEMKLKELILARYGSLSKFCEKIDIPWTTLDSILKRGIDKANITNVLKITNELGLEVEPLANGEIVFKVNQALAAHFEGDNLTPEEQNEVISFVEYVKSKRS